jgi:hypothetical protein
LGGIPAEAAPPGAADVGASEERLGEGAIGLASGPDGEEEALIEDFKERLNAFERGIIPEFWEVDRIPGFDLQPARLLDALRKAMSAAGPDKGSGYDLDGVWLEIEYKAPGGSSLTLVGTDAKSLAVVRGLRGSGKFRFRPGGWIGLPPGAGDGALIPMDGARAMISLARRAKAEAVPLSVLIIGGELDAGFNDSWASVRLEFGRFPNWRGEELAISAAPYREALADRKALLAALWPSRGRQAFVSISGGVLNVRGDGAPGGGPWVPFEARRLINMLNAMRGGKAACRAFDSDPPVLALSGPGDPGFSGFVKADIRGSGGEAEEDGLAAGRLAGHALGGREACRRRRALGGPRHDQYE